MWASSSIWIWIVTSRVPGSAAGQKSRTTSTGGACQHTADPRSTTQDTATSSRADLGTLRRLVRSPVVIRRYCRNLILRGGTVGRRKTNVRPRKSGSLRPPPPTTAGHHDRFACAGPRRPTPQGWTTPPRRARPSRRRDVKLQACSVRRRVLQPASTGKSWPRRVRRSSSRTWHVHGLVVDPSFQRRRADRHPSRVAHRGPRHCVLFDLSAPAQAPRGTSSPRQPAGAPPPPGTITAPLGEQQGLANAVTACGHRRTSRRRLQGLGQALNVAATLAAPRPASMPVH